MGSRISNIYLFALKVGDRYQDGWLDAMTMLRDHLLPSNLTWQAHAFGGLEATLHAAAIGLDRIKSCRVFYLSRPIERHLLQMAVRQIPHLVAAFDDPADDESFPASSPAPWYPVLLDLLAISRRPWAYVMLHSARDARSGHWTRLAHLYGVCNATVFHDKEAFALTTSQLEEAVRSMAMAIDPLEHLLQELDANFLNWIRANPRGRTHYPSLAMWVLEDLCKFHNQGLFISDQYPELAVALASLVDILQPVAADAVEAANELSTELAEPGSNLSPSLVENGCALLRHLNMLDAAHRTENDPTVVLNGIAASPVMKPVADEVISREHMLSLLYSKVRAVPAQNSLFLGLLLGLTVDEVRDELLFFLAAPNELSAETNRALSVVLNRWRVALNRINNARKPHSAGECLYCDDWHEIPQSARDGTDLLESLDAAMGTLENWAVGGMAPAHWDHVHDEQRTLLSGALFIMYMESLIEDLTLIYRANTKWKRANGPDSALIEEILGLNWRDYDTWPTSDLVTQKLTTIACNSKADDDCMNLDGDDCQSPNRSD